MRIGYLGILTVHIFNHNFDLRIFDGFFKSSDTFLGIQGCQ